MMRDGSPIGSGSSGSALTLQFSESIRKYHSAIAAGCELTIRNASFDRKGMLRVQGEVNSVVPVVSVAAYVGERLLGTRAFSRTNISRSFSFNFQSDGRLDQMLGEEVVRVTCIDVTGQQTSKSCAISPLTKTSTNVANKLPQVEVLADAIASHFDDEYYLREYPDVSADRSQLILHFVQNGWYEGRNPNAFFDTVSYLLENQDVSDAGVNPFFHYLTYGRREDRKITPSVSPSIRTQLLFGYEVTSWVELLRPLVDSKFYGRQLAQRRPAGIDAVAHFAYRGWREGKCPNSNFDVRDWLEKYPASARYLVNPVIVQLESQRRAFNLDSLISPAGGTPQDLDAPPTIKRSSSPVEVAEAKGFAVEQDQVNVIRNEFSALFYLATYPDIAKAGVDPLSHFFYTGWREGRCPNQDFDTKYYLEVNADVRSAGINPFWHYLVRGRAEGRLPRRPGGYRREIIDAAIDPSTVVYNDKSGDENERPLTSKQFAKAIRSHFKRSEGLVISLSHDCYIRQIGGTQIFIADEQRRFNDRKHTYIHLSPHTSRLALLDNKIRNFSVRVVVDGKIIGLITLSTLANFIKQQARKASPPSFFIVHCLLGYYVPDVIELFRALRPKRSFYWLHDYSSLCAGFNLLRNNVEFCGAPALHSAACRICVYGKSRSKHLSEIKKLFDACGFEVVSPSTFALNLWQRSTSLQRSREFVHPHWEMTKRKSRADLPRSARKIRVAFVGFPQTHKGWPIFKEVYRRFGEDRRYEFYHFAAKDTATLPGITFVTAEVTTGQRDATGRLLAEHYIDVVLMLSTWPETFSFVAHEAISAGARIMCLADSGNVAELVNRLDCGEVFRTVDELMNHFETMRATEYSNVVRRKRYTIKSIGTSATIQAAGTERGHEIGNE